jgi:hypothetical protein
LENILLKVWQIRDLSVFLQKQNITKYWKGIVDKWIDFFVMKKVVKTTRINKKM